MNKKSLLLVIVLLAGVLAACSPAATPTAQGPAPVTSAQLVNIVWKWADMTETAPAHQSVNPQPDNYTITFLTDGTVNIKADCNNVGGTYTLTSTSLTIKTGPSTLAFCGDQSQDTIYLAALAKVNAGSVQGNRLILQFANGGGQMGFNNGGAAPK